MTTYTNLLVEAKQLLGFIGLQEKKNVLISDLSYGEQRRLEVALGLATRPKLLLLDEPSAGLSSNEEITSLVNILSGLTKDISIVFVAHDMDLVFRLAHRVIVLYYGQIIAQGTPDEIQVNPKVQEIYLGVQEE
jgi:branched-chain amino acid transport system ATP-binding protein